MINRKHINGVAPLAQSANDRTGKIVAEFWALEEDKKEIRKALEEFFKQEYKTLLIQKVRTTDAYGNPKDEIKFFKRD